jgi:putative heme-binding domain-containing protein
MARKVLMQKGCSADTQDTLWAVAGKDGHPVDRRLRHLWTLHAVGGLSEDKVLALLADKEEYIRAWAIQLELEDQSVSPTVLSRLEELAAADASPVVRLYLASALQRLSLDQRWGIASALAAKAQDADDHNIPLVLWYGVEPLVPADTAKAMQLAQQTKIPLLQRYIIRRASASNETIGPVVELLGNVRQHETQQLIMDEMLASFEGRVDSPMPASWQKTYATLQSGTQREVVDKADQLAILFGDQRVFPRMRELLADETQDIKRRRQALDVLVKGQDKKAAPVLLADAVLGNKALSGPAVRALGTIGTGSQDQAANNAIPAALLARYSEFSESTRGDVISTLVSRPAWTTALLQSIGAGKVPSSDLHAYHVRQILTFKNESVNALLKEHWGEVRESSADRQQQIADWKQKLSADVLKDAHPGNGRRVFSKTCQKCHRLFGAGGDIGPDITGSNRANLDYILSNILDPSAVMGRDYRMTVVVLDDGRVVSGMLKQETDSALTVQTINDRIVIPKKQIEERSLSNVSMMPERQLDALKFEEARDLIAYLGSPAQVAMTGPPAPIDAKTGKVPGAIEGEAMKIVEKSAGNARSQPMGGFPKGSWSGKDQLWWTGAKPGDRLALEFSVDSDGAYDLELALTMAKDYGIVKLSVDDKVIDNGIDCFNDPDVTTTGVLSYNGIELSKGNHKITFEITGANPQAVKGYMVGIDFVRAVAAAE